MKNMGKTIRILTIVTGFISLAFLIYGYIVFEIIRPKIIKFEAITPKEESLAIFFGVGLLSFLAFCFLTFFQIIKCIKNADKISFLNLVLLFITSLSLLFIFGDIALLNDIGKQYKYCLSQPEWTILYFLMAFQFMSALVLTWAHFFKLKGEKQQKRIAKDSNIFLIAQYVGVLCGFIGLSFVTLNFFFPTKLWMMKFNVALSSIFLLIPYCMIIICWFIIKFQEKEKGFYDEKQILDIGRSAFFTLISDSIIMSFLFFFNFYNLSGVVSVLWFPFFIFLTIFLFSSGNLYFSQKH